VQNVHVLLLLLHFYISVEATVVPKMHKQANVERSIQGGRRELLQHWCNK